MNLSLPLESSASVDIAAIICCSDIIGINTDGIVTLTYFI